MILFIIATLVALAFLYSRGWLVFTQTGVLKPLVKLTLFGIAVEIKKPATDGTDATDE